MKIKALQTYRWALSEDVSIFINDNVYDINDKAAFEMIKFGYAKKIGVIENTIAPIFGLNEMQTPILESKKEECFENKMVDLAYKKKKGRSYKNKEVLTV